MTTIKLPKHSIICAFPLSGKSTADKSFENVKDLESSLYMFEDSLVDSKYGGDEEAAKGDPTRVRYPDANERYFNAVLKEAESSVDYILTSPAILSMLIEAKKAGLVDRHIFLVQPSETEDLVEKLTKIAIARGNSIDWINNFIPHVPKFLKGNKETVPSEFIIELNPGEYLSDILIGEK